MQPEEPQAPLTLVPICTHNGDLRDDDRSLDELETTIRRGLQTFIEVGKALASIRERRLYREKGYETFDAYCRGEWEWGKDYANKTIRAAQVVEEMQADTRVSAFLPPTEKHVRPLTRIESPEQRAEVWTEVVEEAEAAEEPITAKRVEEKVKERLGLAPAPMVPPPRPEGVASRWHKAMHDLQMRVNSMRDLGGIEAVVRGWPERDKEVLIEQLETIQGTLDEWTATLRGNR